MPTCYFYDDSNTNNTDERCKIIFQPHALSGLRPEVQSRQAWRKWRSQTWEVSLDSASTLVKTLYGTCLTWWNPKVSTHLKTALSFESTPAGTRDYKSGQTGTEIEKYDKDFCMFMHVLHASECPCPRVCMYVEARDWHWVSSSITLDFVYWGGISPWTSQIWLSS